METKQQIRKRLLAERNAMPKEQIHVLSAKISQHIEEYLRTQKELKNYGVYGYYPHGNEVSLMLVYKELLKEKIPLAFPRVSGDTMDFYQVTNMDEFTEGAFHIFEPIENCPIVNWEKAVCLVPGSVFDYAGNRYGYGKGYYDRYFHDHSELYAIGVAYALQVKKYIPTEETDVKMQALATEYGLRFI